MSSVLVLVPAHEEEASVGEVVAAARAYGYDVVVVDDGSADRTADEAARAGARVLRLPVNLGVGGALRCGFRYALAHGYQVVVQCDGDGQHDPAEIPQLVAALEETGADLVIGSRFAGGSASYRVDWARRLVMRVLAGIASRTTGERLTDATSGFRAIRRPLLAEFAAQYPVEYLGDTVEAAIGAARAGYRIREVPVCMRPRATGRSVSASPVASAWYLLRVLLALALLRRARPTRYPALPSSEGGLP